METFSRRVRKMNDKFAICGVYFFPTRIESASTAAVPYAACMD